MADLAKEYQRGRDKWARTASLGGTLSAMDAAHLAGLQAVERAVGAACEQAIADEPEFPGHMPDEMWAAMNGDRDASEEAMRIAVRQTKDGIRARLRALLPRGEK